jgi:uncharacterized protein YbjT (DUF2867 family)
MRDILITGGKGTTGKIVAGQLARLGVSYRIGTRNPAMPGDVAFDWRQPDLAKAAFEEVGAIYVVAPTDTSDHAGVVLPMLEQAAEQGVTRFVLLSASSLEPGGPMMGRVHSWLAQNAAEWAVLRPSWFMQNLHNQHRQAIVEEQAIYTATGDGRIGFIDAGDIASVAVSALTSQDAWNRDYILTGSEAVGYADVAAVLSRELGKAVRHVALGTEAYAERLVTRGMDPVYARTLATMDERIASGAEDRVTGYVHELTGKVPESLSGFVRQNIEKWQPR